MLDRFNAEHWHDEDEVRFIVEGRGLFHVHPPNGPVFAIEVERRRSDPRAEGHAPLVRSLRRPPHPRDPAVPGSAGWTPHYTDSGVDQGFQPLCFGPAYFRAASRHRHVTLRARATRGVASCCSTSRDDDADRVRARRAVSVRARAPRRRFSSDAPQRRYRRRVAQSPAARACRRTSRGADRRRRG